MNPPIEFVFIFFAAFLVGIIAGFELCLHTLFERALAIAKDAVGTTNKCLAILNNVRRELELIFPENEERPKPKDFVN